jgi:hypothetical protein
MLRIADRRMAGAGAPWQEHAPPPAMNPPSHILSKLSTRQFSLGADRKTQHRRPKTKSSRWLNHGWRAGTTSATERLTWSSQTPESRP